MRTLTTLSRTALLGTLLALGQAAPALADGWVPGHYGPAGAWIPGHWAGHPDIWVRGHYSPSGFWIPGHWLHGHGPHPGMLEGPPGPPPFGHHWVAGFYGPAGHWHPGFWAANP